MRPDRWLLPSGLLLTGLLYCLTPVYSENIFWHLRNGEDILDTGSVRTKDPFTWTARGREWIQQEWGAEVAFAAAWRAAGPAGLTALKSLVVLSSIALAYFAALRRGAAPSAAVALAVLWYAASQARWFERPHIFSDLFFSAYLFVLARPPGPWRTAAMLLPLQVLWNNTHAGFVMGLFLCSLPAVDRLFARDWRRLPAWLALPAGALLTTGIHPNGFRSLLYLPDFMRQSLFRASIREWWSPFDGRFGTPVPAILLITLSLLTVILVARRGRDGLRPGELLLLSVLTAAGVFASRNIELLAIASAALLPRLAGRIKPIVPAAMLTAAALVPPLAGLPRELGPPRDFGPGMAWEIYPTGLADFVEESGLYGRVFNTNEISGYLQYRFGSSLPLYMDGRCLVFPESLYAEYLFLAQSPDSLGASVQLRILEDSDIELGFFDWPHARGSLANLMAELPGWAPVYWDSLTVAYASLEFLRREGLESLSLGQVDPLSSEDLISRPLHAVPASLMGDLEKASGMRGWDLPHVLQACLYWRAGDRRGVVRAAGLVGSPELRIDLFSALTPIRLREPVLPQTATLGAWRLHAAGDTGGAILAASALGDTGLEGSLRILESAAEGSRVAGPLPFVPWTTPAIVEDYTSGRCTRPESLAVLAACELTSGNGPEACRLALLSASGWDIRSRPWVLSLSGVVLAQAGDPAAGALMADSALRLSANPYTLLSRGRVSTAGGDWSGAADWLVRAASMAPSSAQILLELGDALWMTGDMEAAGAGYSTARALGYPLPPAASVRMGWLAVLHGHDGS